MRRWSYGVNSLYKTASIFLEDGPAWSFWLESAIQIICSWLPGWLGHEWFHMNVCDNVVRWCWSKRTNDPIDIHFDRAKALFYERDKEFWDMDMEES